jgi:YVTN family beta-propeller protein
VTVIGAHPQREPSLRERSRRVPWAGARRAAGVALLLVAALTTCRDQPTGPNGAVGYLVLPPVTLSSVEVAAFGLVIDSVRIAAIRPVADTLADTTVFFDPNAATLQLALPVLLQAPVETLLVHIELRAGTRALFVADQPAVASTVPDTSAGGEPPNWSYVGPGSGITHIQIEPQDSVVTLLQTQRFRVSADSAGVPVDSFYVSWSTSDTLSAPISGLGLLQAPGVRGAVYVRAMIPNLVHDSTRVTFVPVPTALVAAAGGGQSQAVATRLTQPLRARVTAADLLGVKGVAVRFQAVAGGGSVRDSVVVTDSAGYAEDSVTLGTVTGAQSFTATVSGLPVVTFAATAVAGPISAATSVVSVSSATVASGAAATLTLQAKDSAGNTLATGGDSVRFTATGGGSTGTIGPTTDHGDGAYTASFVAESAGTATTIGATVNGVPTASTVAVTVVPGNTVAARSVITVSPDTILSGATGAIVLQAKDSAGNDITTGGLTVVFNHTGGTSTGTIAPSPATDNGDGTYTATFTGLLAGTATTIGGTVDSVPVASTLPTITVRPGTISTATSVVTVSDSTVAAGAVDTLFLQAKDAAGNLVPTGGATVAFTQSGGTSVGTIGPTTDLGTGKYRALFTGLTAGTPTTIGATIGANPVTSSPLPTIRVFATSTTHSTDITASETWTAAQSPHIVTGYLRVRNGATLTIASGALVKFAAGAGLQVGDTAANQAGGLVLDGTGAGITLTADTTAPVVGFWRGIEVQRSLPVPAWRDVVIEWAGGARPAAGGVAAEACVLLVNGSGSSLELDSLHIRQCNHAAIHHFGGVAHVHRSVLDTVTGSGIHVDFDAQLELDSTVVRGAAQEGLYFGSVASRLLASTGNQFRNNAVTGIRLNAVQLPGLLRQDSIVGNGTNVIEVDGGRPDSSVAAFTLFAQPQPPGQDGYLIQTASLDVGRAAGQALTLDSNVVVRFNGQTGLLIGDSAGTRSGTLRSLGTGPANRAVLMGASGGFPGAWLGVEIGRLSGADTLKHVRITDAGDSLPGRTVHRAGLWIRNPAAAPLVIDSLLVLNTGIASSDTNAAGVVITGAGAGVEIRRTLSDNNAGYGFAVGAAPVRLVGDSARGNAVGLGAFIDGGAQLTAQDSVANNDFGPGNRYPMRITAGALPLLRTNAATGALRDTLLLDGGFLTADATLPYVAGLTWRALDRVVVDSGATFTIAARDTVAFDTSAGLVIGERLPAALAADGSAGMILFTASGPPPAGWHGIDWHQMSGSRTGTTNVFRFVDVDRAGFSAPCFGDCSPYQFAALRFTDSLTTTNVDLPVDHIIVRRSNSYALDFQRGGTGTVSIQSSQFYDNLPDPMIRARSGHGSQLTIGTSDLYHYRGQAIEGIYKSANAADSVIATGNWWGDVAGVDTGFTFQDSLGRASIVFGAVYTGSPAPTPFFPVGTPAGVVAAQDSILSPAPALSTADSIRVRVVDAFGRGVGGQSVTWSVQPATGTTVSPSSGTGDQGGRIDAQWSFGTTAGSFVATASGAGGAARYFADVQPGPATGFNWALDAAGSQGAVTAPKAITFTSTNRRGVVVTNAVDQFGNAAHVASICFADPGGGCQFFYGVVDSTHSSGGSAGDTIFFHTSVSQPTQFVLRGTYNLVTGGQAQDSIMITMASIPVGVRIDRDEFTSGVQIVPDTLALNGFCPGGQPNFYCQREVLAVVVDSGLAPVANQDAAFQWTLVPASGAPVTLTTHGALANDSAVVTALADGFVRLVATDTTPNNFGSDTMPILVQQLPGVVYVTPDTVSVLVGGTATFTATVVDLGGDTMPGYPVHWRPDNPLDPHITIVDSSVAGQVTVRLDSTPFGASYVDALAARATGDTVYGYGELFNPVWSQRTVGLQPWAIAANSQTHAVYVGHQGGQLYVADGTTEQVTDSVQVGGTTAAVAVNAVTNKVYVTTEQGLVVVDGATLGTTSVGVGVNSQGVTTRQGLTVDSVNNRIYVTVVTPVGAAPTPVLRQVDGATNTFSTGSDVVLPDTGVSAAFNAVDGLVYVAIADSNLVAVVNPATATVVSRIPVCTTPFALGLNPVTQKVYVVCGLFGTPGEVSVIDASTQTVVTTIPVYYYVGGITVDALHNRVYVGVSNLSYALLIDGATDTWQTVLLTGNPSFFDEVLGLSYDAGNGKLFTANYSSRSMTILKY